MKREDELIQAGWERRFIACEPRLSEMAEMYEEIGLKVRLEPLPTKEEMETEGTKACTGSGCSICFDVDKEHYRIIFTKPAENK
jgi:hypothetical protein